MTRRRRMTASPWARHGRRIHVRTGARLLLPLLALDVCASAAGRVIFGGGRGGSCVQLCQLCTVGAMLSTVPSLISRDRCRPGRGDARRPAGRVRSHCRFRNRGTEYVSESGIKWMRAGTKRRCGARGPAGWERGLGRVAAGARRIPRGEQVPAHSPITSSPQHLVTPSPRHPITSSPRHLITSSSIHLISSASSHLITSPSPLHLIYISPPLLTTYLTTSPPRVITITMVTSSPPHPPGMRAQHLGRCDPAGGAAPLPRPRSRALPPRQQPPAGRTLARRPAWCPPARGGGDGALCCGGRGQPRAVEPFASLRSIVFYRESRRNYTAWCTQDCISSVILHTRCISYTTVLCHDSIV
jgi:hypothetical protein